jgi:hypothetical protein
MKICIMEKKVIVEFLTGEKFEIDAASIAKSIVEIHHLEKDSEAYSCILSDLLEDANLFFENFKELPWIELQPSVHDACKEKSFCYCNAWRKREAKIKLNW